MDIITINPVLFVGAGPGDPELITVKGQNAIKHAEVIIYAGSLVPEALLIWNENSAETMSSASMSLDEIISRIKKRHEEGKRIVRLHTGDPSLYGAIFEQIAALEKEKIPCRVIPGVTAAFAAAAAMNMEYTLPEITQTLILTRIAGRTPVPETEDLERLASHKSSMAIYLSMAHIDRVQEILSRHYGEASIAALAYKVSHPEEKIIFTPINRLAKAAERNSMTRHALILVGRAVEAAFHKETVGKSLLYDAGFSHGYRKASITDE